jgi:DNA polymerase elongation subunit (family B)
MILNRLASKIPTNIAFGDIGKLLPKRSDFMNAAKEDTDTIEIMPIDDYYEGGNMLIMGVTPSGANIGVVLTGIPIFVEVMNIERISGFASIILDFARRHEMGAESLAEIPGGLYDARFFSHETFEAFRIKFPTIWQRKTAMDKFGTDDRFHVIGNDPGYGHSYYNKMAREFGFNTANWNSVAKYKVFDAKKSVNFANVDRVISCDIADYRPSVRDNAPDQALLCSWDIETYTAKNTGEIPAIDGGDWEIINIGCTFGFQYAPTTFLDISIISVDSAERSPINIICNNEREVLCAFLTVLRLMSPNYMTAYNGGHFDWPYVRYKIMEHGLITDAVQSMSKVIIKKKGAESDEDYCYRLSEKMFIKKDIKLGPNAKSENATVAKFPGIIDTDAMHLIAKNDQKASILKTSLNAVLAKNNIPSKFDMPIPFMFKVYEWACLKRDAIGPNELFAEHGTRMAPIMVKYANSCPKWAGATNEERWTQIGELVADICEYCITDAYRLHQLYDNQAIIANFREVANLTFLSVHDAIYCGNSKLVINLIAHHAHTMGIGLNMSFNKDDGEDKEKYAGGKVFPPMKMIDKVIPVSALDFASLYPSLILALNLSANMLVDDPEYAAELVEKGYTLNAIEPFKYDGELLTGWTVNNRGITAPGMPRIDHYRKTVTFVADASEISYSFKLSAVGDHVSARRYPPEIVEWIGLNPVYERKTSTEPISGSKGLPNERAGLLPTVVTILINMRKVVKRRLVVLKETVEKMKAAGMKSSIIDGHEITISEALFNMKMVETKSNAIKVLTNSIYGICGMSNSPIYNIFIANGITQFGQKNVTLVHKTIIDLGHLPRYGDTDSVYFSVDPAILGITDADQVKYDGVPHSPEFIAARLARWAELVHITIEETKTAREIINDLLICIHNNAYLTVDYEEVGFPSVFCGKKKYFFYEHIKTVNFYPEKMKIAGLDTVRGDKCQFTKTLATAFMREVLSPDCDICPLVLCKDIIDRYYATDWETSDFIRMATYKPNKKNICVINFVKKLTAKYGELCRSGETNEHGERIADWYIPPEAGEKFKYVVVRHDRGFNLRGNYNKVTQADRMMLLVTQMKSGTAIDKGGYVKELVTCLARLICFMPEFEPEIGDENYTAYDKQAITNARKWIVKYIAEKYNDAVDVTASKRDQTQYFRAAVKRFDSEWAPSALFKKIIGASELDDATYDEMHAFIMKSLGAGQDEKISKYVKLIIPYLDERRYAIAELVDNYEEFNPYDYDATYGALEAYANKIEDLCQRLAKAKIKAAKTNILVLCGEPVDKVSHLAALKQKNRESAKIKFGF